MKFKVMRGGHDVAMREVYLHCNIKDQSIRSPKIYTYIPVHRSEGHIAIVEIGQQKMWGEEYIYHAEQQAWYFWLDFIELERHWLSQY